MPTPSINSFTGTRNLIKTLIKDATGGTPSTKLSESRIFLGYRSLPGKAAYDDADTNGPFVIIGVSTEANQNYQREGTFAIPFHIFIAKSMKTSWEGTDIDLLIDDVITKLLFGSCASTTSGARATRVDFQTSVYETDNYPGLLILVFNASYQYFAGNRYP